MASTSETGHAKNVANFEDIIAICIAHGKTYNPSKTSIKINALHALAKRATDVISDYNTIIPAYHKAVGEREEAFSPLSKLTTRIKNALMATDASKQLIESASSIIKKIQGVSKAKKKISEIVEGEEPSTQQKKEVSTSQMSYDNRLNNFDKLIQLLTHVKEYVPNEKELQVATLKVMYNVLKAKNSAVTLATIPLENSRTTRNEVLYNAENSLYDTAADIKTYIKSVFGASSPQYKQVSKIKFTSPR